MIWNPFKLKPKSFLGVDVGSSSIKIVELSREAKRIKLDNYGEMLALSLYEKPFRTFEKSTLTLFVNDVVRVIGAIIKEAGMQSRKAYFPIPDFSTFFTSLNLPPMSEEELPQAVQYQARQHIPLPLSEVTLDWQRIDQGRVLLVAVPNEIIYQYKEIAEKAQLELVSMEAEVFSLIRALVRDQAEPVLLVDMGARSTTCSVVKEGTLQVSHSFDTGGNDLTQVVAKAFNVDYPTAEEMKRKYGLSAGQKDRPRGSLLPLVDLILQEVRKIIGSYFQSDRKEVQKIILAGGSAWLPGLADYFSQELDLPVVIANPFAGLAYPPILEDMLKQMGPSYAVAVGAALFGLQ